MLFRSRNAVQSLWASSSSSPFADEVRTVIKAIQSKVKQIQKLIAKAQEVQTVITGYIQQLQQLIAYIASLPARIAAFLQDCLAHATSSLKYAIANAATITTASANASLAIVSSQATAANNAIAGSSAGPAFQKP